MLTPGSRLGPYEIVAPLGAGGMGEVFKARDTRLERSVAIKVLPADLAHDPQFKLRFEREAKSISALNHPHICTLYDVGHEDGTDYLVMELIEGESLADRLAKDPLPIDQVLRYGAQIADALDRAHRSGVVHRDLKPGNIMLTKNGAKLLDFGLAKSGGQTILSATSGQTGSSVLHTEHKPLTREGTILGTFQYMAPEQLEGEEADPRTDIFALGAVLYEMATGKRAFEGKTKTSLIAAIVSADPIPISRIQPLTPFAFEHVVQKCLSKERDDRWQSAHDIAEELRWIGAMGSQAEVARPIVAARRNRERIAWVAAVIAGVLITAAIFRLRPEKPRPNYRFTIPMVDSAYRSGTSSLLSPDGAAMVFVGSNADAVPQLYYRRFDSFAPRALEGTTRAWSPRFSPDGRKILFVTRSKLHRMSVEGGPAQVIADLERVRGLAVGNGVVLAGDEEGGIRKVTVATGAVEPLTTLNVQRRELGHVFPQFLPDLDHFLFTTVERSPGKIGLHHLYAGSLSSRELKLLGEVPSGVDYGGGYLFMVREGTLQARRFDAASLTFEGEPVTVADGVGYFQPRGDASVSAAEDGTVAWQAAALPHRLTVLDANGKLITTLCTSCRVGHANAVSPDGGSVIISLYDPRLGTSDLWSYGITRDTKTRLTFEPMEESTPVLSSDGSRLFYASDRNGVPDVFERGVDGAEPDKLLAGGAGEQTPLDVSNDDKFLLYRDNRSGNGDMYALPLQGGKPIPAVVSPAPKGNGRFSPDGRFISYNSAASGRREVYIKAFQDRGQGRQISTAGGFMPRWSADGKTLYFIHDDAQTIMAATEQSGYEPRVLFKTERRIFTFGVLPGNRFVAGEIDDEGWPPVHVAVRWPETVR